MALSEEDRREILELIGSSYAKHCWLAQDEQREMSLFVIGVRDMGGGDLHKGVTMLSKAVSMVASHRKIGAKIGGAVATVLLVGGTSGLVLFVWAAVVDYFKRAIAQ